MCLLQAAAKAGLDSPYVWLRIAECLIALADEHSPSLKLPHSRLPNTSPSAHAGSSPAADESSHAESAPAGDDSAPLTDGATSAPHMDTDSAPDDSANAKSATARGADEKLAYARQCLCTAAVLAKEKGEEVKTRRERERLSSEVVRGSSGSLSDSSSRCSGSVTA